MNHVGGAMCCHLALVYFNIWQNWAWVSLLRGAYVVLMNKNVQMIRCNDILWSGNILYDIVKSVTCKQLY